MIMYVPGFAASECRTVAPYTPIHVGNADAEDASDAAPHNAANKQR